MAKRTGVLQKMGSCRERDAVIAVPCRSFLYWGDKKSDRFSAYLPF